MPASDLDAIRARLAAYDAAHREPETPDALRRIMAASLHFPADLRALLKAHDADRARVAELEAALQTIVGYGERHGIGPGVFDASYTLGTVADIARRALTAPEGDDDAYWGETTHDF